MDIVRDVRFGCDYMDENNVLHVGGDGGVMVTSQSQLTKLPESYGPGTIAHTAGWLDAWEKGINGTWISLKGGA